MLVIIYPFVQLGPEHQLYPSLKDSLRAFAKIVVVSRIFSTSSVRQSYFQRSRQSLNFPRMYSSKCFFMLIFTVTISIFSLLIGFFTLFSLCVCVIFCDQHVNRPTGNIKYDANLLYFNDIIGKILRNMRPTKNSGCWSPLPTVNSASFFPEFRIIANSDQQKENDDQQETTAYFYLINIYIIDYYIFILYLF